MARTGNDLLRGTLDMLVLKTLALEEMHGWGICERIRKISQDVFDVNQGSLYPALQRLTRRGLITSEWRTTANNRRARYYALTVAGRAHLGEEIESWSRTSSAVNRMLAHVADKA